MKVTFAGTRGSCAVSAFDKLWFGGNTPCLRVDSQCLPEKHWLIVDAGTGILPLSWQFAGEGADEVTIILTHSHHDHTGGFPLSLFPYLKRVLVNVYGPVERGMGPREVYKTLMQPPFFPVDLTQVGSHLRFFKIEKPNATVLVIHPVGGRKSFAVEAFERLERDGRQIPFRGGKKFNLNECLVIKIPEANSFIISDTDKFPCKRAIHDFIYHRIVTLWVYYKKLLPTGIQLCHQPSCKK